MKIKKKIIIITVCLIIFTFLISPFSVFASNIDGIDEPQDEGFVAKSLGKLAYVVGWFIDTKILSDNSIKIDTLVYNQGDEAGVILTKDGPIRDYFLNLYLVFDFMAMLFIVPIGLTIGFYFLRAEDPQRKSILLDKFVRLFFTIVLLHSMPTIIEFIFKINDTFVSVASSIVNNVLDSTDLEGGFLMDRLRELAQGDDSTLGEKLAYLFCAVLNIWLIFFYFIRDISIAFLFCIFPILAIFYPFDKSRVVTWFKEMLGNIGTQAIHAFIFTAVIFMSAKLPTTFINTLYIMTAFGLVIPMTAIVKRLLGFEGSIGAASSLAGLGMMYGAIRMGSSAVRTFKRGISRVAEGGKEYLEAVHQESKIRRGETVPVKDGQLPNLNRPATLSDIQLKKAEARKKALSGIGTIGGGMVGGTALGLAGVPFGIQPALISGSLGAMVGGSIGGMTGNAASYPAGAIAYSAGKGIGKAVNLGKDKLLNKDYSHTELESMRTGNLLGDFQYDPALKKEKRADAVSGLFRSMGMPIASDMAYDAFKFKNKSPDELKNMNGLKFYQDKKHSFLYTTNKDGNKTIHWMGEGNSSLTQPISRNVYFSNDAGYDLSADIENNLLDIATVKASEAIGVQDENDPKYREQFKQIRTSEYNRLKREELGKLQEVRRLTGFQNISFQSMETPYIHSDLNLVDSKAPLDIQAISNIDSSQLKQVHGIELNKKESLLNDGVGYMSVGKYATLVYKVDPDSDGESAKLIGIGNGDPSLGEMSRQYARIKFENGDILAEQVRYAVQNIPFQKVSDPVNFKNPEVRLGEEIISNIEPNTDIVVTVNYSDDGGMYNIYNASNNTLIGQKPIPQEFLGDEIVGTAYHITVNQQGEFKQHYIGKMTTNDSQIALDSMYKLRLKKESDKERIEQEIQNIISSINQYSEVKNVERDPEEELISSM